MTQAFAGEDGKQEIITAYLNQNYYGNQSYGVKAAVESLLRQSHARGHHPGRRRRSSPALPEVAVELRPRAQRRSSSARPTSTRTHECPEGAARRPGRHDHRPAAQRHPRPAGRGRPHPAVRRRSTRAADFEAAKRRARSLLASQATPRWIAPHFVWAVRDELTDKLCGAGRRDVRRARARRPARHDDPRRRAPEDRREVGPGRGASCRTAQGPGRQAAKALGFKSYQPWMREPARTRTSATARSSRSTTRPASSSRTSAVGELLRDLEQASVPAAVRRRRPGLPPAGLGVQAVQLRDRHRRRDADRRRRCSWTSATDFGGGYTPNDADNLERGPVRVRNALQFSLNIPSVKAMAHQRRRPRLRPRPRTSGCSSRARRERRAGAGARRRRRSGRSTS